MITIKRASLSKKMFIGLLSVMMLPWLSFTSHVSALSKCDIEDITQQRAYANSCLDDSGDNECVVGGELANLDSFAEDKSENRKKAFLYLVQHGLAAQQAAGIIGNLMQESGLNPFSEEHPGTDTGGKGIAQWTASRRISFERDAGAAGVLTRTAAYNNVPPQDKEKTMAKALLFNLEYLWKEATLRGDIDKLKNEGNSVQASVISWEKWFERAGNPQLGNRLTEGQRAYDDFAATAPESPENGVPVVSASCSNVTAESSNIVAIALSQEGIKEGTDDCNKYFNGSGTCSTSWCAVFARWVYKQAGLDVGGGNMAKQVGKWFSDNKTFFKWSEPYRPQPGDVFVKGRGGSGTNWEGSGHIGIVVSVEGFNMVTIEGNSGDQVKKNTYADYRKISELIGFGRYADKGSVPISEGFDPLAGKGADYYDAANED